MNITRSANVDAVHQALRQQRVPVTTHELAQWLGWDNTHIVGNSLQSLLREGSAARDIDGKWLLTESSITVGKTLASMQAAATRRLREGTFGDSHANQA